MWPNVGFFWSSPNLHNKNNPAILEPNKSLQQLLSSKFGQVFCYSFYYSILVQVATLPPPPPNHQAGRIFKECRESSRAKSGRKSCSAQPRELYSKTSVVKTPSHDSALLLVIVQVSSLRRILLYDFAVTISSSFACRASLKSLKCLSWHTLMAAL